MTGRTGAGSGDPCTHHQREPGICISWDGDPHILDNILVAVLLRGSQLWAAPSLGALDLVLASPSAQLRFLSLPCGPWGSVSLRSSPVRYSHTAGPQEGAFIC